MVSHRHSRRVATLPVWAIGPAERKPAHRPEGHMRRPAEEDSLDLLVLFDVETPVVTTTISTALLVLSLVLDLDLGKS